MAPGKLGLRSRTRLSSVLKSERMYELKRDAEGTLYLDVVAGSSTIYTLRLVLDRAERAAWEREGERFLDRLAAEVAADEVRFSERLSRV